MNFLKMILTTLMIGITVTTAACGAREPSVGAETLTMGEALYTLHCAACHGANLEGQPNWKEPDPNGVYPAPPHNRDGHTWHHPDSLLLEIIAEGGSMPNSAMPGFREQLSQEEMEAILVYIKSFWGPEELEFQRTVR